MHIVEKPPLFFQVETARRERGPVFKDGESLGTRTFVVTKLLPLTKPCNYCVLPKIFGDITADNIPISGFQRL